MDQEALFSCPPPPRENFLRINLLFHFSLLLGKQKTTRSLKRQQTVLSVENSEAAADGSPYHSDLPFYANEKRIYNPT